MWRTCVTVSVWVLTCGPGIAKAQIVLQHTGSNDPKTEGWNLASNPGANAGPVTNDQNTGLDAWSLGFASNSNSSTAQFYYNAVAIPNAALTNGWEFTTNVRFAATPSNSLVLFDINLPPHAAGETDASGYSLLFRPDLQGHVTYQLSSSLVGGTPVGGPVYAGPPIQLPNPTDYHLFQIQFDAGTGSADLLVDGAMKASNFVGIPGSLTVVNWGIQAQGSSPIEGQINASLVQFSVVPEPSGQVLMVIGSMCLLLTLFQRICR